MLTVKFDQETEAQGPLAWEQAVDQDIQLFSDHMEARSLGGRLSPLERAIIKSYLVFKTRQDKKDENVDHASNQVHV